MTIKRKILISNIMTLAIPLFLTGLAFLIAMLIFAGVTGIDMGSLRGRNDFNNSVSEAAHMAGKWNDGITPAQMENEVKGFNARHGKHGTVLYVYSNGLPVFEEIPQEFFEKADKLEDGETLTGPDSAFYKISGGGYTLTVIAESYSPARVFNFIESFPSFIVITVLSAAVIITCLLFARFLTRSVTQPIKILTGGVHELRDGNLSFRLEYGKNDEFSGVVGDFNEMAGRLEEMVQVRQKNETNRRELIAGISHDLRTPLTSVKAYVEGLEKGIASTPQSKKKYFATIKSEIADLEHIINQLFLFSKLDIGDFPFHTERVDVGNELEQLVSAHKKEYEKQGLNVSLVQNVEGALSGLDAAQFRNVIHNILGNSVKYKNKDTAQSEITCRTEGGCVIIRLSDNGPGVGEDALERLFDVFYRGDSSRGGRDHGSGLGLAISKKIVERLGGSVRAENAPEGGLTVEIRLPRLERTENEEDTDSRG